MKITFTGLPPSAPRARRFRRPAGAKTAVQGFRFQSLPAGLRLKGELSSAAVAFQPSAVAFAGGRGPRRSNTRPLKWAASQTTDCQPSLSESRIPLPLLASWREAFFVAVSPIVLRIPNPASPLCVLACGLLRSRFPPPGNLRNLRNLRTGPPAVPRQRHAHAKALRREGQESLFSLRLCDLA